MVARIQDQSGYVALLAVLIAGAAATTIALLLLMTGVDSQRATLIQQQAAAARSAASACAEDALQVIHDNTSFSGSNTRTDGTDSSCTYSVTVTGANTRIIDVTGSANNEVVRRLKVYVTITSSSISITSWQEVADA